MRASAKVAPSGDTPRRMATAINILDDNTLQEFTPASASDASAASIKFAHDSSFLYIQLSEGVWVRAALSTW